MVVIFSIVIITGNVPFRLKQFQERSSMISYATAFTGGVFMAVALIHLSYAANQKFLLYYESILSLQQQPEHYPFTQLLTVLGFSIILFLEKLIGDNNNNSSLKSLITFDDHRLNKNIETNVEKGSTQQEKFITHKIEKAPNEYSQQKTINSMLKAKQLYEKKERKQITALNSKLRLSKRNEGVISFLKENQKSKQQWQGKMITSIENPEMNQNKFNSNLNHSNNNNITNNNNQSIQNNSFDNSMTYPYPKLIQYHQPKHKSFNHLKQKQNQLQQQQQQQLDLNSSLTETNNVQRISSLYANRHRQNKQPIKLENLNVQIQQQINKNAQDLSISHVPNKFTTSSIDRRTWNLVTKQQKILKKSELQNKLSIEAYILQISFGIHSILEGTAIGISQSFRNTLILGSAVFAHKWAEGLLHGMALKHGNVNAPQASIMIFISALMNPIGLILGWIFSGSGNLFQGVILSISAGTFLYVATLEVLAEEFNSTNNKFLKLVFYLFGVGFISSLWFLEEH